MALIARPVRPLFWLGSSKRDYRAFPPSVQETMGFHLHLAQTGLHPPSAKPLKGLGGGMVELIGDADGDTYRAVYTVRYAECVFVLHAFKKKSKRGVKTPQREIDLIRRRLQDADTVYAEYFVKRESKP